MQIISIPLNLKLARVTIVWKQTTEHFVGNVSICSTSAESGVVLFEVH